MAEKNGKPAFDKPKVSSVITVIVVILQKMAIRSGLNAVLIN